MISRMGIALAMLLMATPAHAYGVGLYVEYGRGHGELDFERRLRDMKTETDRIGVGVLLETNVSKEGLFSYRGQLGWQYSQRDLHRFTGHFDGNGLAIHQAVAIGASPAAGYRMWIGPSFRFSFDQIEGDRAGVEDVEALNVGIGPQVGINWDLGPSLSASASLAYQYMFVNEDWSFQRVKDESHEHLVTFGVSLLLRFEDDSRGNPRERR